MTDRSEVVQLPVAQPRETTEAQAQAQALASSLASIRADAREQARRYQDETIVPEGGE